MTPGMFADMLALITPKKPPRKETSIYGDERDCD